MVTKVRERVTVSDGASEELAATVSQQLEDIAAEKELPSPEHQPNTASWYYRVPCPGVRYYSY